MFKSGLTAITMAHPKLVILAGRLAAASATTSSISPTTESMSIDSSISARYWFPMTGATPINAVMRALADPTRRAVFEQVVSSDEISVVELTRGSGVTQGAISQHLKALKQAGLVVERPEGRNVYYRARPEGLEPLVDWMSHYGVFWRERFANLRTLLKEIDP
jgi:DNA-binding transcriptional ArsR family regulator